MDRRSLCFGGLVLLGAAPFSAQAASPDKAAFEKLAKEVLQAAVSKKMSDPDAMMAKLDEAAKIGAEFCKQVAAVEPANQGILNFVVANFDKIRATPFESFEDRWHAGAGFQAGGHDMSKLDQSGKSASAIDAVVHPLTARAAIGVYKTSKKADLLETVVQELEEVLGHLKHL
jgi:hypothetical protein